MDMQDLLSKDGTDADPGIDGALHSIPTLWDRPGWKKWLRHVEGVARLLDVWDYVDPSGDKQLEMPVRPQPPAPPDFEQCGRRRPNEMEDDFQIRLLEYRFKAELANRKLAIREESYRLSCLEYSLKLRRFAARKQALRDLDMAIFVRASDHLQSHLNGDSASTPRLKLKKLESVIMGAETKAPTDAVDSRFLHLMDKIEHPDPSDWAAWATGIQDTVEACPELAEIDAFHKAAKAQFLAVISDAHELFANTWENKCVAGERPGDLPVSFYDILDAFIQDRLTAQAMPLIADRGGLDGLEAKTSDGWPSPASFRAALMTPKIKKQCPGCQLTHLIRDDAWWEDCYVFHQYAGRRVPSWFKERADRINKVKARFKECPAEEDLAMRWESCS